VDQHEIELLVNEATEPGQILVAANIVAESLRAEFERYISKIKRDHVNRLAIPWKDINAHTTT
jgi:hypothetical protein